MNGISTVALGDLMVSRGGNVNPAVFPDEAFDLYSIPAYDKGIPEFALGRDIGSAKQVVQEGDVLLSRIVPHIRRSWVVRAPEGRRLIASGEWIIFRSPLAHPPYLRHVLLSDRFHADFMSTVSGVGGSLLRARPAFVAKIQIPLPPLGEQQRIAEVLERADELRAKRRQALAQLDDLTQSIFLDMFGDPRVAQEQWKTERLEEICLTINDCPHSTPKWTEAGDICLRTSNLTKGGWDWTDTRYVSPETFSERSRRGEIQPGDIVLSREGTVGVAAIVENGMRVCMGQRLVQVRPNPTKILSPFLLRFLLNALAPEQISKFMVGSTSRHLNVKDLKALLVPLPPIELQHEFALKIETVGKIKERHRASLAALEALFASLQDRAFKGLL